MATQKVLQGADAKIPLDLLDNAGLPLNTTTVDGIVVHLKDKNGKKVAQYNFPTRTDYQAIQIIDGPNGKTQIQAESFTTKNIIPGSVFAEVMTETTDAGFQNGIKFSADVQEVMEIIESSVKSEVDITP